MQLIKITDEHYIVVDYIVVDEITEGEWYIDNILTIRQSITSDKDYWSVRKNYKKITHSTQPLEKEYTSSEEGGKGYFIYDKIKELSLQEVKEIISEMPNGNKIDSMAEKHNFGELEFQTIDNRTPCDCHCHREPNTIHFMACCNNGMIGEVITKLKLK
jgi:hypothetical protein